MKPPVLLDAGPLVALIDSSDQHHEACGDALASFDAPFLSCLPVLAEAAYLLRARPRNVDFLMSWVSDPGFVTFDPIATADLPAVSAFMSKYQVQLADACLLHLADRHGSTDIFTVDRNDFSKARTTSGRALMVIP